MYQIVSVDSGEKLKDFIDFPHELYKADPNYVPELFIAQKDMLTPGKHPFHDHSEVKLFLAYQNQQVVGRIAAILNNNYNKFNQANHGFFGFFETINEEQVAELLLSTARRWLQHKKVQCIIGPANFSTNETCGLLIEGFDSPPVAMMPYNPPYYAELLQKLGFQKKVDLFAYQFLASDYNDKSVRLTAALTQRLARKNIIIRPINLKNFKAEVAQILNVYNLAWEKNLGFVPMTPAEFNHLAKDLKLILDPNFCMIAEHNGQAIGFSLAIPDINQILRKIKKGRLLPTGIFRLLFGRKKINAIRIITLGVIEGYRKLGIEACFYGSLIQKYREKNMQMAEASWILENNTMMNQALQNLNGKPYKTYRIYEQAI